MAIFVTPCACALGLGEIQVNSNLGEPLKAQINLIEPAAAEVRELKARLASFEEYKKNGLQFPEGIKFTFQVINEPSAQPFVRITTSQPINDLFVDLLIEISLPSVKILKSYTFLLNPQPDQPLQPVVSEPPTNVQQAAPAESLQPSGTSPVQTPASQPVVANAAVADKPVKSDSVHKSREHTSTTKQHHEKAAQTKGGSDAKYRDGKHFGKLSMSLSMSLSISKSEPGNNLKDSGDALQEELIAKEKMLNELKAQIAEMQGLIRVLQGKLGLSAIQAASSVAGSGVLASSSVAVVSDESIKPQIVASAVQQPAEKLSVPVKSPMPGWTALGLAVLLLAAPGLLWYRKRKTEQKRGLFDELNEVPEPLVVVQPSADTAVNLLASTPLMKNPKYKKDKDEPALPEEYELLDEADICLRFGHDKQAEEVVREAININPKNPHTYLVLLRIYALRENKADFMSVAQHIESLGDKDTWKKAAEMGRTLDPDNPLYAEFA